MTLNHLNLTVDSVSKTRDFLRTYFGLQPLRGAPDNDSITILSDDEGMILTMMRGSQSEATKYPSSFHIGFVQDSEDKVNEINQRLKEDGFDVKPPRHFHGSWTFYLRAPGGFLVEVLH